MINLKKKKIIKDCHVNSKIGQNSFVVCRICKYNWCYKLCFKNLICISSSGTLNYVSTSLTAEVDGNINNYIHMIITYNQFEEMNHPKLCLILALIISFRWN